MRKVVSIDFGTTNCVVSYCDNGRDIEMARAYQEREIIPSTIAYEVMDGAITIGNKELKGNVEFRFFEAFKMLLSGKESEELLSKYGYDNKYTPQKVTEDFIAELMKLVKRNIGDFDELFVTIPHIWEKNTNLQSKENLKDLFAKCGYTVKKFIPEPVAAASYFCYKYSLNSKMPFNGHLLVIDWGGGTLDISLCEANQKEIKVLETSGFGDVRNNEVGKGGYEYDRFVCLHLLEKNGVVFNPEEINTDPNFLKLLNEFERIKISSAEGISIKIENYLKDNLLDNPINFFHTLKFGGKDIVVCPSDLVIPFDEFKNALIRELNKIDQVITDNKIDTDNRSTFKIIPTGGFCAYYLVEYTIADYYKSLGSNDLRFPQSNEITPLERGLAISKGATAIGAGLIDLVPTVMWTVGVKLYEFLDNNVVERSFKIFEKGKKYKDYKQKQYLLNSEILYHTSANNAAFKLFIELNGQQIDAPIYKNSEFFPTNQTELIKYKLAYQIVDDTFFMIIEYGNIRQEVRRVPLSKVMELFSKGSFIINQ